MNALSSLRKCHSLRIPIRKSLPVNFQDKECVECPQNSTCMKEAKKRMTSKTDEVNVITQVQQLMEVVSKLSSQVELLLAEKTHPLRVLHVDKKSPQGRLAFDEFPGPGAWPDDAPPRRNMVTLRFELGVTYKLVGAEPTPDQRSLLWRQIDRVFLARHGKKLRVLRENRNNSEPRPKKPNGKSGKWSRVDVADELGMVDELYDVVCEVLPVPADYFMPLRRYEADEQNLATRHTHDERREESEAPG